MENLKLIESLISELSTLQYRDETTLDAIQRRAEMIVRNMFGEKTKYLQDLHRIGFRPSWAPSANDDKVRYWQSGTNEMMNLFNTIKEELTLFHKQRGKPTAEVSTAHSTNKVFIVHGRDEEMKIAVARTLDKLKLNPVILHEQPNKGRTIIEKFTDYSDVGFAIVLLSPDDVGRAKEDSDDKLSTRARQNVILELGYFLGKLGRESVLALYKPVDSFEMATDYAGVVYVPYDDLGRWQFDLVRELKACNYEVDANSLV